MSTEQGDDMIDGYIPTYRVHFTAGGEPYITEDSCYGFVLWSYPLGDTPGQATPTGALAAAINLAWAKLRPCNAGTAPLTQVARALDSLLALDAARKQWKVPPIEMGQERQP